MNASARRVPRQSFEVDWVALVAQLRSPPFSLSFAQIAERSEISKSSLVMMGSGMHAQPLHANGEQLIQFWCRVTNLRREDLPMIDRGSARSGL
jgi:hypothetical protein